MSVQILPRFTRDELIVAVEGEPGEHVAVTIGGVTREAEAAPGAELRFPLAALEVVRDLRHDIRAGRPGEPKAQLPPDELLDHVNIRTEEEFFVRIQNRRGRPDDAEAVRFCARRLLRTAPPGGFHVRAAALCALGYRVVEAMDPSDTDIPLVLEESRRALSLASGGYGDVRWTTSVTMMLVYLGILRRDLAMTESHLRETLSYRPYLPVLSLLHTNFSRCATLLALFLLARGEPARALDFLADVEEIYRVGVRSSFIHDKDRGRHQFSEILAVLKSARLAAAIAAAVRGAEARGGDAVEVAFATGVGPMSPILRNLLQAGHWPALLEAARSGGRPPLPLLPEAV